MNQPGSGFLVSTRRAPAAELVLPAEPAGRFAVLCYPTDRAIVLGSTQGEETIDSDAARRRGAVVVRRRSGGGAVYVAPGAQVWLDLFVPANDELARSDVARAAYFVGELWCDALRELLGPTAPLAVHEGAVVSSSWSRTWCYSGLGPGEVTIDGRKLVGLSQRRNRAGAWFFTMACRTIEPDQDARLLAASPEERAALSSELARTTASLDQPLDRLEAALVERLSSR